MPGIPVKATDLYFELHGEETAPLLELGFMAKQTIQ